MPGPPSSGWAIDDPAAPRYHSARDALAAARLATSRDGPVRSAGARLRTCSDGELFPLQLQVSFSAFAIRISSHELPAPEPALLLHRSCIGSRPGYVK